MDIHDIKSKIFPICQKYKIEHMYLFGSQAKGNARADSDVDFFLDKPGAIKSIITLSGFRLDLEEALGKEVDIITALDENSIFGKEVQKDMVSIFVPPTAPHKGATRGTLQK